MKKSFIILIAIIFISCGKETENVTVISKNDAFEYYQVADSAATELVKKLGGRLVDAIQNDGVIKAIDVCQKEAYKITDNLTKDFESVVSIKRVSNKYRNPKNAPDKYEKEALAWFENQSTENAKASTFGHKITSKKGDIIKYYKPMFVQNKCLLCHGDNNTRMPEVSKRIEKLYPDDLAIGYKEDDFRGLIRVEMQDKL